MSDKIRLILIMVCLCLGMFIACNPSQPNVQSADNGPLIVPKPRQMEVFSGYMEITENSKLVVKNSELRPLAQFLSYYFNRICGFKIDIVAEAGGKGNIVLQLETPSESKEYGLNIEANAVLKGSNYKSMALGSASLLQVFKEIDGKYYLPKLSLVDGPQYDYRSVMLDVARFWHPVETIKETIDLLWFYKIPYLQLHLSDNRRFVFPMDEYPDLKTVNEEGNREYYTLEELEDLVEYGKKRGVALIPEVDLPGHSTQLWRKYPDVFGSVDPKTGKAKNLYVINMAKEKTYAAVESIINRLAEVFYTSPYIHMGGDEVYLKFMAELPEYKAYCKKNGLKTALEGDANELFCHFINRVHDMVKKTGKKTIAWEGFHGKGAGDVEIDNDITLIVWNTTYNRPDSLLNYGFEIINSTWIPWYEVSAMNFAPDPKLAYEWDLGHWTHWNDDIPDIRIDNDKAIVGGQITFWEQNYSRVIEVLKDCVPVLSERLWNNEGSTDYNDYQKRFASTDNMYDKLFRPVTIEGKPLVHDEDLTFEGSADVAVSSKSKGTIKYAQSKKWGLPNENDYVEYANPFLLSESTLITAQLFDENNEPIGYPVQKYFTEIEPIYNYKVYETTHETNAIPDFKTRPLLREGVSGRMNPTRIEQINRELFAKVKVDGHIDTRFEGIYNPYGVELTGNLEIPIDGQYEWQLQTWDGLAEIYIDGVLIGGKKGFENKPELFESVLIKGKYPFVIKYYYKNIQNQLSILFRKKGESEYREFEELVLPLEIKNK